MDLTPVPQAGRGDPTALVAPLPPPQRESSPWPTSPTPHGGVAQGSWPQSAQAVSLGGEHFSAEQAQKLKKQFVWAGGGLVALVMLIAMIKACGGSGASETKDEPSPPDEGSAVTPPPRDDVRPAVAIDAGVAPVTPDAAEVKMTADAAVIEPPPEEPPPAKPPKRPKRPGTKRPTPTTKKFDPNAPLPPR